MSLCLFQPVKECRPMNNNAGKLFHYRITVSPPTNFLVCLFNLSKNVYYLCHDCLISARVLCVFRVSDRQADGDRVRRPRVPVRRLLSFLPHASHWRKHLLAFSPRTVLPVWFIFKGALLGNYWFILETKNYTSKSSLFCFNVRKLKCKHKVLK